MLTTPNASPRVFLALLAVLVACLYSNGTKAALAPVLAGAGCKEPGVAGCGRVWWAEEQRVKLPGHISSGGWETILTLL